MSAPSPGASDARVLRPLVSPTRRAMEWLPAGVTAVLAVTLVARAVTSGPDDPAQAHLTEVRLAMLLLAAGAGFALDDPSEVTVAGAPVTRARRRMVRVALAASVWFLGWSSVLALLALEDGPVPVAALSLEAATWVAVSLAVASIAGGVAAGPALLAGVMVAIRLPGRWALLVTPGGDAGRAAQGRWLVVLGAAVVIVVWSGLDPARRHHRYRGRGR